MNNITNSVRLLGHLGKDVEIRTLENGSRVASATIATNSYYTNVNGEKISSTEWHNIVAWNKTAELMASLLKKGSKVMVEGALKNDSYKDKDGQMRYSTKVRVHGFQVLSPKEEPMPF